ncbi:MAG: carboxypeptidase-like regulatory domain-containing protein [Marinilabiliales bacterium]|nr:carboxypeptidase-like regulatory domain-containing protein [Marinilabiliales bacterium]
MQPGKIFLAGFFLLFLVCHQGVAQSTGAMLYGKVRNESEAPMAGVKVEILYLPWQKRLTTTTNAKGVFRMPNLAPGGPYVVRFSCKGYEEQVRSEVSLELGENNDLSLHMRAENIEAKSNDSNAGSAGQISESIQALGSEKEAKSDGAL